VAFADVFSRFWNFEFSKFGDNFCGQQEKQLLFNSIMDQERVNRFDLFREGIEREIKSKTYHEYKAIATKITVFLDLEKNNLTDLQKQSLKRILNFLYEANSANRDPDW
jgi:hypothetical protein